MLSSHRMLYHHLIFIIFHNLLVSNIYNRIYTISLAVLGFYKPKQSTYQDSLLFEIVIVPFYLKFGNFPETVWWIVDWNLVIFFIYNSSHDKNKHKEVCKVFFIITIWIICLTFMFFGYLRAILWNLEGRY